MARHFYTPSEAGNGWLAATCRCGRWWSKEAAPMNADIDEVLGMLMVSWQGHVMSETNLP